MQPSPCLLIEGSGQQQSTRVPILTDVGQQALADRLPPFFPTSPSESLLTLACPLQGSPKLNSELDCLVMI